jgi:hypothetical protein
MNLKPIPLPPEINTNSLEELSRSMDELSKWSDSFRRSQYENLRSSAGPIADKFILSEEAAIKGFESTDCNVCLAALYALEFHWPPSLQAMQALKHLARQSPYETVVSAALAYLSRYYHGSKEGRCLCQDKMGRRSPISKWHRLGICSSFVGRKTRRRGKQRDRGQIIGG